MAYTEKYVSSLAGGGGDGSSGSPWTWAEMVTNFNTSPAATRYNVLQNGTYSLSATTALTGSGTVSAPLIIRGYKTTIGDGYLGRINGNQALITTNMPTVAYGSTYQLTSSGTNVIIESIIFTASINGQVINASGVATVVTRCSLTNSYAATGAGVSLSGATSVVIDNDIIALTNCVTGTARVFCNRCTYTGDSTRQAISSNGGNVCGNTILAGNGIGINNSAGNNVIISGNTIYAQGVAAIQCPNSAQTNAFLVVNNELTDCAYALKNPYNATAAHPVQWFNNRTRDNTNADLGYGDWPYYGAVTTDTGGAETDYVNAAGGDLRLVSTSPAKGAGLPAYADIGALQRQESNGGASQLVGGGLVKAL